MAETENPAAPRIATTTSRTVLLALIAVVLATGVAGLSWLDARHRIGAGVDESDDDGVRTDVVLAEVDRHVDDGWCLEAEFFYASELPALRIRVVYLDQSDLLGERGPPQRE